MLSHYVQIMRAMLWRDLHVMHKTLKDMLINSCIWATFQLVTNAYILPLMGMPATHGIFMFAGMVTGQCIIQSMNEAAQLVSDLCHDKETTQYFTLPIPTALVFVRFALMSAFRTMIVGLIMIPVGKIILWNQFQFTAIAWPQYFVMFIVSNLFFGMGSIWIAARTPTLLAFENTWMRLIVPLWFLSTNFSWAILLRAIPALAYIDLINPILYTVEGLHATMLNPADFMPYWVSLSAVTLATVLVGWRGITLMKRRLDFV